MHVLLAFMTDGDRVFLTLMMIAASVSVLALAAAWVAARWLKHWSLLPPPTTEKPLPVGVRATLEGVVREADETLPVPDEPERHCVAWACTSRTSSPGAAPTFWIVRSRPFYLELDGGRMVSIALRTRHWHTNSIGVRDPVQYPGPFADEHPTDAPFESKQIALAIGEAPDDDELAGDLPLDGDRREFGFADISVGDRVTLSGFFTPNLEAAKLRGYRDVDEVEAYYVQRASALPPDLLPRRDSIVHRRGRDTWLSKNHVLFFAARHADVAKFFHAGNRRILRDLALFGLPAVVMLFILTFGIHAIVFR